VERRTGSALAAALIAIMVLSGCARDETKILPPVVDSVQVATPTFDGSLEPGAAVLALVPEDVDTVTVTDFDQVRLQMGLPDLGTADPKRDRESFWTRAVAERPLLSEGMLRPIEPDLSKQFGLSQLDVAWEARFHDAVGNASGFVLAFRDGTDMAAVQRAVDAGFVALEGATVDTARRLVTSGTTSDAAESWAADEDTRELVGLPANATYLARGCVDGPATGGLDDLELYSVQFEGTLATARLGEDRMDLFPRMRLGGQVPKFEQAYDGGVADPLTGRIGYVMNDPAAAASMALAEQLPFAACA
jgi:hypothetical protein